jgi:uncharacterized protein
MGKSDRFDVYLVAGGKYHDIDFARLELLKLLAEQPRIKVRVGEDYRDTEAIGEARLLVSYTCDVMPDPAQTRFLCDWVERGGKWLALHGTNSILRFLEDGRVDCPDDNPEFMQLLGSQFLAHPSIQPYTVQVTEPQHPLTRGVEPFSVDDELYLSRMHGESTVLLHTEYSGHIPEFYHSDWSDDDPRRPVMYLSRHGWGEVLYLTLGHCRGKYDMQPLMEEYPVREDGAWKTPEYYELLRRGIRWGMGELGDD